MRRAYTGIGSRRTPGDVLEVMEALAARLAVADWVLRSGHAHGADQAFEQGAGEHAEIYLPWPSYEAKVPRTATASLTPSERAFEIARDFHPGWDRLRRPVRLLMARNSHAILGQRLDDPSHFVVCWTPDGSLDGRSRDSGGTGQALRIAFRHGVPIFNLARSTHRERVEQMIADHREAEFVATVAPPTEEEQWSSLPNT